MRIKLNKENWSGEEITINVNRKTRSWKQFGYTFTLKPASNAKYEIWGSGWSSKVGTVTEELALDRPYFRATAFECSRTHENPFAAAAQLLCNII
jgi:hypothetical protein